MLCSAQHAQKSATLFYFTDEILALVMERKERKMDIRRLQSLALIVSAICVLLGLVAPNTTLADASAVIGILLFMFGIPAVNAVQPTGWVGPLGIILLEIAAVIVLGFRLDIVSSSQGGTLSLINAILGMLGAVIIGWLTIREDKFPAWLGWLFLVQGVLNFIAGSLNFGSLSAVFSILVTILYAVALFAFGYYIYQRQRRSSLQTNT